MPRPRPLRVSAVIAGAFVIACDIPTGLPKWDTTFVVQAEHTTLSVAQLLPSSMSVSPGNAAFTVALSPATRAERLHDLCRACGAASGQTITKPGFRDSLMIALDLPGDVSSGTISGGSLHVAVRNGFSFDPFRSGGNDRGKMTIRVHSGSATIATVVMNGADTELPAGAEVVIPVPLTSATVAGAIRVAVIIDSPPGDRLRINGTETLGITITATDVTLAAARIKVTDRHITASPVTLRLKGIDAFIVQRVTAGHLVFSIDNPFACAGTLTMRITGGTRVITKSVAILAGASVVEVALDEDELRAILGNEARMTMTGPVSSSNEVVVSPAQMLTVSSRLKLVLGPASQ